MVCHLRMGAWVRAFALAVFVLDARPVGAECAPDSTAGADTIVCTGLDDQGVDARSGDDSVNVTPGARVESRSGSVGSPQATGIDAGDGSDIVFNGGAVLAETISILSPQLNPPFRIVGASLPTDGVIVRPVVPPPPVAEVFWDAFLTANPRSAGIDGGRGDDTITSTGSVEASASATTLSATLSATVEKVDDSNVSSKADASSTAVSGAEGDDTITLTGAGSAGATATAAGVVLTIAPTGDGKSKLEADVTAGANATGLAGGAGVDAISGLGTLDVTATSTVIGAGGSGPDTQGGASASAKSTAEAVVVGIDAGDGNDLINNQARIGATAESTSVGLAIGVGVKADEKAKGKVEAAVEGSASASSTAIGIAADGQEGEPELKLELAKSATGVSLVAEYSPKVLPAGDDSVRNSGEVSSTAQATTAAAGVGVAVSGKAAAKTESTAEAVAASIDLGGGKDSLVNSGKLLAKAESTAVALGVSVGVKTDPDAKEEVEAAVEGNANARASATGIATDGVSSQKTYRASLTAGSDGVSIALRETSARAAAADKVTNLAEVGTTSTATAVGAGVGVVVNGKASADVKSEADAKAATIDLGSGDDMLANTGKLASTATADATSLNIAVGVSGKSSRKDGSSSETAADGGATAKAVAQGISGDGVTAGTARGGILSIDDDGPLAGFGLRLGYDRSTTHGVGNDNVSNDGEITASASATARAGGVGITVKGAASANSTAESEAAAQAIDLGRGADVLMNSGKLGATATSSAQALKAAISTEGKAQSSDGLWRGGVKADAVAAGIDAAGAADDSTVVDVRVDNQGLHARYETRKGDLTIRPDGTPAAGPGDGADRILNRGDISADAGASSVAINVAVTADGTAAAVSHVEASASASGIRAGAGADAIDNLGAGRMDVRADATAIAGKVAVSGKGVAVAADALWDGGTRAEASATGIDGDGGTTETELVTVDIAASDPVRILYQKGSSEVGGADAITNEQAITTSAEATAPSVGVALEAKKGLAAVISKVGAESTSTAIRGGDGNDRIANSGKLEVDATTTAVAASVAIAKEGAALATDSVWDGGTRAEATAIGIDGDGGERNETSTTTLTINRSGVTIAHTDLAEANRGNDTIGNTGAIESTATATSVSASVSITTKGLSAALSQATASAASTAIRGGDGDDTITNSGALKSTATATAVGASVAVTTDKGGAIAANAVWDGGVTAEATARGIDADGGNRDSTVTTTITTGGGGDIDRTKVETAAQGKDMIVNSGRIEAVADAVSPEVSVAIAVKGVAAAISTATARADTAAIDAGAGDDGVDNTGVLDASSTATAVAVNASVTDKGVSIAANNVWDGGVKADAQARGIAAGDGLDRIDNDAGITATAKSTAPAVSAAVSVTGAAAAVSTGTASAEAVAIDAGDDADQIFNLLRAVPSASNKILSKAEATAATVNVAVTNQGLAIAADAVWDGGTHAGATARGIQAGGGVDAVANKGEVESGATATAVSAAVSVAVTGVAGATATSTASADAAAIDAGEGNDADTVSNDGNLKATAKATAAAASVSVTNTGVALAADSVWDGGTKANAQARGIAGGDGGDTLANHGAIVTESTAVTAAAAVSVAVTGVAGASATSTANSVSTAIDAGTGADADTVTNTGKLTVDADAIAVSTSVSITSTGIAVATDAVWDGGTTADALGQGIATGAGADLVTNAGEIVVDAVSGTGSVAVSVAVTGVAGAVATSTSRSTATAIDTGADADAVTNTGKLKATAGSVAATVTVGVTTAGVAIAGDAAWSGGTHGDAVARGIATGSGADLITNDGQVEATADATTASVAVSVAVAGVAGAVATSTATSVATAIDAGDGGDTITYQKTGGPAQSGKLIADADALAVAATVTVTVAGAAVSADAVWDGGTHADAGARGIDSGSGADVVDNRSEIESTATATTASAAVAVAVKGVAGAIANATGQSYAAAIDGGTGNDVDRITNTGKLKSKAETTAVSAAIGFTVAGVSVAGNAAWDGGTTALAASRGIAGGGGADLIDNAGEIGAIADADAVSVSAAISVVGVAGAVSTATAEADARAIDGGEGDDTITNRSAGKLAVTADATGTAVNVAITGAGVAVAADSVWQGGTQARATARGIDGGAGADKLDNFAEIGTTAIGTTHSISIAVSGIGAGGAVSTSTATADATALAGSDGADVITNSGKLGSVSTASATGVAVTATGVGIAAAADAFWDGGTRANAVATGIAGGAGDDRITNTASLITTNAKSDTLSVAVAVSGVGLSGAAAASTSTALSTGLAGGAGNDTIVHTGEVLSRAGSTAEGVSVAITMLGGAIAGSFVDNATVAEAQAIGIDGGDGDDTIGSKQSSTITLLPKAEAKATAVGISLVGFAGADAQARAMARATGIDGGRGADTLDNDGTITTEIVELAGTTPTVKESLVAEAKARSVSVAVLGASNASATATAEANATGIDGGGDNDILTNRGGITLNAGSIARGQSLGISVAGTSISDARGISRTLTTGLAGGAGDDTVTNHGTIALKPAAQSFGQSVGISVVGSSVNDASALADASATGLDGGSGKDVLINANSLEARVASTATSRSSGVVIGGSTVNRNNSAAVAAATGIDGGSDADRIANATEGVIDLFASARTVADTVTVTAFGAARGEAQTRPTATSTGIAGGEGADEVSNDGTVEVESFAESVSKNSSTSVFGSSGGSAGSTAEAIATGIDAGSEADRVFNRGTLTVVSRSRSSIEGSSWTLAGKPSDSGGMNATSLATGIAGGEGGDLIRNEGTVTVTIESIQAATGGSKAIFGSASSGTRITAETDAVGIAGGAGSDTIQNVKDLEVTSTATLTSNKSSVSFAGAPSSSSIVVANGRSTGVDGGTGDDTMRNEGSIIVSMNASASATGGAGTTFGGTNASGVATSEGTATGIEGGEGNDAATNTNTGTLQVTATTDAATSNTADAGWITGDANTVALASSTVAGRGISLGDGDNTLQNDQSIKVQAKATGYTFGFADGAKLSWAGDGQARADSQATSNAVGLLADNGNNRIFNRRTLDVDALATTVRSLTTTSKVCDQESRAKQTCTTTTDDEGNSTTTCEDEIGTDGNPVIEIVSVCEDREIVLSSSPTYAAANGNGLTGDGNASSRGTTTAEASGIVVGDGDNLVVNEGDLLVTATSEAKAIVSVSGGPIKGNATGSASATAGARAYGIRAGDGNNDISNDGMMNVAAITTAQAQASIAAGKGICITFIFWTWCIADGTGTGTATAAFDSLAAGIRTGDGDNVITNRGQLTVSARTELTGSPTVITPGIDVPSAATSVTLAATGVEVGDGNNRILNAADGVIDVTASTVLSCSPQPCSLSAFGIVTGNGNNLIRNDGIVSALALRGAATQAGIAIRTGSGNDTVSFGNASTTTGRVELGAGDDLLNLEGGALIRGASGAPGSVDGGAGTDGLSLVGTGSYGGAILGFETAAKDGAGTYALASLPTMQRLTVRQGSLQTGGAYTFAPGGHFEATVFGGGEHGRFSVSSGQATLGGTLAVAAGPGMFRDGEIYDIVSAPAGVTGTFSGTSLPAPTPLLTFGLQIQPEAVQVNAFVAPFSSVAVTGVGSAVAAQLDAVAGTASSDFADVMGVVQGLPSRAAIDEALVALSPASFDGLSRAASAAATAQTGHLTARLGAVLANRQSASRSGFGRAPVQLAQAGDDRSLAGLFDVDRRAPGRQGLWLEGFGRRGEQEGDASGQGGFDFRTQGFTLGYDRDLDERWTVGAAYGYSRTDVDVDGAAASGDIGGRYLSIYGLWGDDRFYAQGIGTFGRNTYRQQRRIDVGGIERIASSDHEGDAMALSLAGGYMRRYGAWSVGPFLGVNYASIDEKAFRETGAGSVDLLVASRRTASLVSDIGVRATHDRPWRNGRIVASLEAAWSHDFAIDDRVVSAAFAGAPGTSFSIEGADVERDGGLFGAGIGYVDPGGVTASLRYRGEFRPDYRAHGLFGEMRIRF